MKIEAALALAEIVQADELDENYIIPDALDARVAKNISACIMKMSEKMLNLNGQPNISNTVK